MQHHHRRSESEINQPSTAQRENQAPNQQQIPSRRSGYVNSGAETEVDANSQSIKRKQRRQRFVKLHLLHFVVFFHLASLLSTRIDNEKVGVDNKFVNLR